MVLQHTFSLQPLSVFITELHQRLINEIIIPCISMQGDMQIIAGQEKEVRYRSYLADQNI